MHSSLNLSADVIDLRDVTDRFEELQHELTERHEAGQFMSEFGDWITNSRDNSDPIHAQFGPDEGPQVQEAIEEFYKLRELLNELKGNGGDHDWEGDWYPLTLIRDDYFIDYAVELADDIGAVNHAAAWPNNCIDWAQAARELQQDYTTVEVDGETYWYR